MKFCADSSLVVKLYLPDRDLPAIQKFLSEDQKILSISELARVEILNVLVQREGPVETFLSNLQNGKPIRVEPVDWAKHFSSRKASHTDTPHCSAQERTI